MSVFNDFAKKNVAYLCTYPPRECGIATFTKDLLDSIDDLGEHRPSKVIAINEKGATYDYEKKVKFQIKRDCVDDYVEAANYVNSSSIDIVNIQHEFGLYGGDFGEYLTYFMENVRKPVVVTLHTVKNGFEPKAQAVLNKIVGKSAATVVIAKSAVKILKQQGISCKKYVVIPHGCPAIPFVDSEGSKSALGLEGRFVVSTFGLINRSKGIEYAIKALPSVIERIPKLTYLIIGETHPEVRKKEGEKYRRKLMQLVCELGLEKNVLFHNRFLSKRELIKYLQATDVYVTPYISPDQISSGTLVYALGAGKAVISTPYLHALEVLADGRGLFAKFKDSQSIANCLNKLSDETLRKSVEAKAYKYSRQFLWSNVAKKYVKVLTQINCG